MGSNTQVKKLLEDVGLDRPEETNFDNTLNTNIQKRFDTVFKDPVTGKDNLAFSANQERTRLDIKIIPGQLSSSDETIEDEAPPLELGDLSSPAISISVANNEEQDSLGEEISLNLVHGDEAQVDTTEQDLSNSESPIESLNTPPPISEVHETLNQAEGPVPTRTRLQVLKVGSEHSEDKTIIANITEQNMEHDFTLGDAEAASEEENSSLVFDTQEAEEDIVLPTRAQINVPIRQEKVAYNFDQNEVARLQSIVREMRVDRDDLLKQIQDAQKELKIQVQSNLSKRAEVEDCKVELNIFKKRHNEEMDELKHQVRVSLHKKEEYEERVKNYQKEFERLGQKVQFEVGHVKKREKELETKLELLIMDSQAQIQSRDNKTLELKRKIDALEFNMENLSIQESKAREDKVILEDKLNKIMKNLRGSIKVIESDLSHELSSLNKNDPDKNNS
jgi:hypothetical protein